MDHRRRVLDHLERVEAEKGAAKAAQSDPQMHMKLIGEVRRPAAPVGSKRRARRVSKLVQPRLQED